MNIGNSVIDIRFGHRQWATFAIVALAAGLFVQSAIAVPRVAAVEPEPPSKQAGGLDEKETDSEQKKEELTTDYPDIAAVNKAFSPKANKDINQGNGTWLDFAYPKGGYAPYLASQRHRNNISLSNIDLKFLDLKSGRVFVSDFFTRKLDKYPKVGTIIAYPRSDFEIEKEFTYIGMDKNQRKVVLHGKLVSVKIILGYPAGAAKLPSELSCVRTVQNLATTGMAIPDSVGKRGKIKSLVEASKMRFGAASATPFWAANPDGKVQILLIGVDKGKAQEKILPATY